MLSHRIVHCQHDARISQPISQRYSKESQSSSPVDEPRVYRTGVMGSRDPSQSVGPSNTSPLAVPEVELITTLPSKERFHALN
jgi:hypothetical protein